MLKLFGRGKYSVMQMSSQQGRVRLDQPPGPDQQASIYNEMAAMTLKGSCDSQLCRPGQTHMAPARLQGFQAQHSSVGPGGLWCHPEWRCSHALPVPRGR